MRCQVGDLVYDQLTQSLGFIVEISESSTAPSCSGCYVEWFDDVGQPNFEYADRFERDENGAIFIIEVLPF